MAEQKSPGLYPEEKRLMDNFEREGWRAVFIAIKGEENARLGWQRGSFYIYDQPYDDHRVGATSAALLMHCASGYMVAPFADLEDAARAAEIAEPLADWNKVFAGKPRDPAVADARTILRDAWPFFPIEMNFANEPVLLHNDRAIPTPEIA